MYTLANKIHCHIAGLMLVHCLRHWPNIVPILDQYLMFLLTSLITQCVTANTRHWTNAGSMLVHRIRRWPNIKPALARYRVLVEWTRQAVSDGHIPANMRYWPNVVLLLGQHRRRWANSKSTLGQCHRVIYSDRTQHFFFFFKHSNKKIERQMNTQFASLTEIDRCFIDTIKIH